MMGGAVWIRLIFGPTAIGLFGVRNLSRLILTAGFSAAAHGVVKVTEGNVFARISMTHPSVDHTPLGAAACLTGTGIETDAIVIALMAEFIATACER